MNSDHIEGHSSFAHVSLIPYTLCPIHPTSSCSCISQSESMVPSGCNFGLYEINQVLTVPHIFVRSLDFHAGYVVIIAIWHSKNRNHGRYIWPPWEVTSCFITRALPQIHCWWLVASPSLLPRLQNLACTFLQQHLNSLVLNPFNIIKISQWQPVFKGHQKISNHRLTMQGSIWQLFPTVLSPDNGPMLPLQEPSQPYFLPLVEDTEVGLPHPLGKLLQGEFCLLQANWGFAYGPGWFRRIIAPIMGMAFVIGDLW